MSGEYRIAIMQFVEECMVAVTHPHFPICSILLEQIVNRILVDLNSSRSSSSSFVDTSTSTSTRDITGGSSKKDYSFVFITLELIGNIGASIRPLITETDMQYKRWKDTSSQALRFTPHILEAISSKCDVICQYWQKSAMNSNIGDNNNAGEILGSFDEPLFDRDDGHSVEKIKSQKISKSKALKTKAKSLVTAVMKAAGNDAVNVLTSFHLIADVTAAVLDSATSADLALLDEQSNDVQEEVSRVVDEEASSRLLYLNPEIICKSFNLEQRLGRYSTAINLSL